MSYFPSTDTAQPRLAKTRWTLPVAFLLAMAAFFALGAVPLFAQSSSSSTSGGSTGTSTQLFIEKAIDVAQTLPIVQGDTVNFTMSVTSTVSIHSVIVTDLQCSLAALVLQSGDNGNNILEVGEIWNYACSVSNISPTFPGNNATVNGRLGSAAGAFVYDYAFLPVTVLRRGIDIEKTSVSPIIQVGQTAVFTLEVRNMSGVGGPDIIGATISDPGCTPNLIVLPAPFDVLSPGEVFVTTCSVANVAADFDNTATVSGSAGGVTVSDIDTAHQEVINAGFHFEKSPAYQTLRAGETAKFELLVKNTGSETFTTVNVQDAKCTAAPVRQSPAGDGDNLLEPGETWVYTCSTVNVTSDFQNTGQVTVGNANGSWSDFDTTDVDVINAILDVTKSLNAATVQPIARGANVIFDIVVKNTITDNAIALTDIVVSDAGCLVAPVRTNPPPGAPTTLPVGGEWTYSCTAVNVQDDFINTAKVTAKAGTIALDRSATLAVDVLAPGLDIEKTARSSTVLSGTALIFDIAVRNTGQVTLTTVTVTDAFCPGDVVAPLVDVNGDTLLSPREVWNYVCTVPASTYASLLTTGNIFTNKASVTGIDQLNPLNVLSDDDIAEVDVVNPKLNIEKDPPFQVVYQGQKASFTIRVSNPGTEPLTNIKVVDPLCSATPLTRVSGDGSSSSSSTIDNILQPDEVWVYECSVSNVLNDFTNFATVTALRNGIPLTDTDLARVDVVHYGIEVEKKPDTQTIDKGATATFSITVRSSFTDSVAVPLGNVTLKDANCSLPVLRGIVGTTGDLDGDTLLDPTEIWIYDCSRVGVTADFVNRVEVTATFTAQDGSIKTLAPVADEASVKVLNPFIDIEKSTDTPVVFKDSIVAFNLVVRNTGATSYLQADVVVTDAQCNLVPPTLDPTTDINLTTPPPFTPGDGILSPFEAWTYNCVAGPVTGDATGLFRNIANVQATNSAGVTVSDDDRFNVTVINPQIDLEKAPNFQTVEKGKAANFTLAVRNTGDRELSSVVLTDARCSGAPLVRQSGDTDGDNRLDLTEIWRYSCSVANVSSDFINYAKVTAIDGINPVESEEFAEVDVINPILNVTKILDTNPVTKGHDITFTISVVNSNVTVGESVPLTDVVVTDLQCDTNTFSAPVEIGGDGSLATLDPGATWQYTCVISGTHVINDFVNDVTVTAKDSPNRITTLTDFATAPVDVLSPGIDIEKSPDGAIVTSGSLFTFTLKVRNQGEISLTNVIVTDTLCIGGSPFAGPNRGDTDADNYLDVTETWEYDCPQGAITAGVTNYAQVTANDDGGNQVEDDDYAKVTVVAPSLDLEKNPSYRTILSGQSAEFELRVTNTGDKPLSNVKVEDLQCDGGKPTAGDDSSSSSSNDGLLGVGEVWVFTCKISNITADTTNYAKATGQYVVNGQTFTVSDDETAIVDVVKIGLNVVKTLDTTVNPIALKGKPLTFLIEVSNKGLFTEVVPLKNIILTDTLCSPTRPVTDTARTDPAALANNRLDVGESWFYTCTVPASGTTADFTNFVEASGVTEGGLTQKATDDLAVSVATPGIILDKEPPVQTIIAGEGVSFTIKIRNTSAITMDDVGFIDNPFPQPDIAPFFGLVDIFCENILAINVDADLSPGETWEFQCGIGPFSSALFGKSNFINTASAYFQPVVNGVPTGEIVRDDDSARVLITAPGLDLVKTVNDLPSVVVVQGSTVALKFTVRNLTDLPLTITKPTDARCDTAVAGPTGDSNSDGILQPTETWVYTCEDRNVQADYTNFAIVTGLDPFGTFYADNDEADIRVVNAGIDVEKTAVLPIVPLGGTASFLIKVKNTGAEPLSPVTIVDGTCTTAATVVAGTDSNNDGILQAGEEWTLTCDVVNATTDVDNTVSVSAKTMFSLFDVTDSDTAKVKVGGQAIDLTKTPSSQTVLKGGTATFTVKVKNNLGVNLSNVKVTDDKCTLSGPGDDSSSDSVLAPGESWTFTCSVTNVQTGFTNRASVTASDGVKSYNDSDTADVTVQAVIGPNPTPGVAVKIKPGDIDVPVGGSVSFDIQVENTGNVALSNVLVNSARCATQPPARSSGDNGNNILDVGEVWHYTCVVNNIQSDFDNTASVSAIGNGTTVTDSDSADVDAQSLGISISKSPKKQTVRKGSAVNFIVQVTNRGDTALTNVQTGDSHCALIPTGGDVNSNGALDVGESWSFACTIASAQADINSAATASATDSFGGKLSSSDEATVDVINPSINVRQSVNNQTVLKGSNVEFTMLVENLGDTTLSNVQVNNSACTGGVSFGGGDTNSNNLLDPGEKWTFKCLVSNVQAAFLATTTVTASDPNLSATSDSSNVQVNVVGAGKLVVAATRNAFTVNKGEGATLNLLVTNNGDGDLRSVNVTVDQCAGVPALVGGDTNGNGVLNAGETWSYSCTIANIQANLTANARVTALDAVNNTVEGTTVVSVSVTDPNPNPNPNPNPTPNPTAKLYFLPLITK